MLLAIDDEQWLDGPSAAALTFALRRIAVGPLELEPLRRLLETRLGVAWTRPVLVRILATSGGNPLYALELARALARGDPAVPATLRGLLSERLSRLPPGAADLLALAAAGDQPDLAVLAEAAGRDVTGDLDGGLTTRLLSLVDPMTSAFEGTIDVDPTGP